MWCWAASSQMQGASVSPPDGGARISGQAVCLPAQLLGNNGCPKSVDLTALFTRIWHCMFPWLTQRRYPGRLRGILTILPRQVSHASLYRWASGFYPLSVDVCLALEERLRDEARVRLGLADELAAYRAERERLAKPVRGRVKARG